MKFKNEDGQLHREDGAALVCADGDYCFFLNGNAYFEEGWFCRLTDEQQKLALKNKSNWKTFDLNLLSDDALMDFFFNIPEYRKLNLKNLKY